MFFLLVIRMPLKKRLSRNRVKNWKQKLMYLNISVIITIIVIIIKTEQFDINISLCVIFTTFELRQCRKFMYLDKKRGKFCKDMLFNPSCIASSSPSFFLSFIQLVIVLVADGFVFLSFVGVVIVIINSSCNCRMCQN